MSQPEERASDVVYLPMVAAPTAGRHDMVHYDPSISGNGMPDDEGLDLRELLRIARRYRWTIASVLLVFVALTLLATLVMRPVYKGQALMEIKPNTGVVKFQNIEPTWESTKEFFQTQSKILQSDSVAKAVIASNLLENNAEINGKLTQRGFGSGLSSLVNTIKKRVSTVETGNPVNEQDVKLQAEQDMLHRFSERLTVQPIRNTHLFEISFESFDPKIAALVPNSVAEEYQKLDDTRRFNSNSGAKEFLEAEIEKVRAKLETSEKDLTEFARVNRIVDVEDKSNIMVTRMQELSTALSEVQTARISAETLYNKSAEGAENLAEVLDSELVARLKAQLADAEAEIQRNAKIYKPEYPKMVQLAALRDDIAKSLAAETSTIKDSLRNRYEQLLDRERLVSEALERQKSDLLDLKERAIQYNILKREWETNKELYGGLLERMKEMGVAGGLELNSASIVDAAATPRRPFKPNLLKNLLLAILGGLLGGFSLALLLAYLDNTINSPEALEQVTGISSLGMIPLIGDGDMPEDAALDLVSQTVPEHEASEAYRSVRTSMMFSSPDATPKIVLLTSTTAGEGKSTSAVNLATVLSQNGASVLLVDSDLRKPRLHKVFGVENTPGVTDFLVGATDLSPRKTNIENLYFLPSGTPPPNPAEMISSNRMDEFLRVARSQYDFVVVDSPPILGLADAVVLSTKVDGTILVVASGKVSKDAIREGVKRLRTVRGNLLGTILNQVTIGDGTYGYYNRYYYRYASDSADQVVQQSSRATIS